MFCSLAVDLRVTQLVDGNKGIHAMLVKPETGAHGSPRFTNPLSRLGGEPRAQP